MKVICSWCEVEGRSGIVREKEPLDDPDETHGVCAEHKAILGEPDGRSVVPESDLEGGGR